MAKRKRLEPARGVSPVLETKSAVPDPAARAPLTSMRPPIADVAQDAAAHAAFAEVSRALTTARETGRLIQALPLEAIDDSYLVRDRILADIDQAEMAVLVASLKDRGQQTAIEVTDLGGGSYGLISGWRRLHALREIASEDPMLDTVLAVVRTPDDMAAAYQAMVDENEIRTNLSFYERARIVARARDGGVFHSTKAALGRLFGAVPRARRSKINSFVAIVDAFDDDLRFPVAITEKLGLAMAKALETDPGFVARLRDGLAMPPETAAAEAEVIQKALTPSKPPAPKAAAPETIYIREGLTMTIHPEGRVVLEGARMTEPYMLKNLRRALDSL